MQVSDITNTIFYFFIIKKQTNESTNKNAEYEVVPVKLKFNNVNNSTMNFVKTLIFSDLDATWPSRDICEHELLQ
jgi:hypothetical protein